ncbi:hypothetical protein [Phaeodactylibacter xiamenensis]|uniref:hypothetical protein n=1 Tax=Phaeodactylibacter xiamenensis TaxID=1524460 RepID=UPI0024A9111D|nr:hypothetical protein [Phaeodactylibacter xiamenensis]
MLEKLNLLKNLRKLDSSANMMQTVMQLITEPMSKFMDQYNKPQIEGGLLRKGDVRCIFAIMPMKVGEGEDEVELMVPHVLILGYDSQSARWVVTRKHSIQELINQSEDEQGQIGAGAEEEE